VCRVGKERPGWQSPGDNLCPWLTVSQVGEKLAVLALGGRHRDIAGAASFGDIDQVSFEIWSEPLKLDTLG